MAPITSTSTENERKLVHLYYKQGPVSRKSRKLFGPEKPFVKLQLPYSVKLVFSYAVKGIRIKITAKFRASRSLRFEDTKRIMSPEMRPNLKVSGLSRNGPMCNGVWSIISQYGKILTRAKAHVTYLVETKLPPLRLKSRRFER